MSQWEDEIFEAAELITEWHDDDLQYKLYRIPREVLDDDVDEIDAHMVHGIDSGNVRRIDITLDLAYGRLEIENRIFASELLLTPAIPEEAKEILRDYIA